MIRSRANLWKPSNQLFNNLKWMRKRGSGCTCIRTLSQLLSTKKTASSGVLEYGSTRQWQHNVIRTFCSKSFGIVDGEEQPFLTAAVEIESAFQDSAIEFEGSFWPSTDEDMSHVRVKLYPTSADPVLSKICEAESIQEILDIVSSIPPHDKNETHSSQALVSLWDLQKIFFRIGPNFDPVKDFSNRRSFVEKLRNDPTFCNDIVQHVVSNLKKLEDEPLGACLLCLKRLDYLMKSEPCQILIEECVQRKETFTLPAVSRLAVCMKSESTYGSLVMVNFLPFLAPQISNMKDDLDIRLTSITLRSVHRLLNTAMVQSYRSSIRNILTRSESHSNLEIVTLCKILLCLLDTKTEQVESLETSPRVLMRQVGKLIAQRSDEMSVIEILSLHRFMDTGPQEPMELVEALVSKISTLIEEDNDTPRLDLITCILPFVKSLGQRQQLATYVREYLDNYPQFEVVSHVLLKILKVLKLNDTELYDKFWSRATGLVTSASVGDDNNGKSESDLRKVMRFAVDYLGFNHNVNFSYRHRRFERETIKLLYLYLTNYYSGKQPSLIYPADIVRALTFLIAFSSTSDPIFTEDKFLSFIHTCSDQLRVADLHLVARGIEASLFYQKEAKKTQPRYFNAIMDLSTQLEDTVNNKLVEDPIEAGSIGRLSTNECISIAKLHLAIKRAFGDSPVFHEAIKRWPLRVSTESLDSKLGREMATTMLCSNYYSPPVCNMIENFIIENGSCVGPDLAEKFTCLAYSIGHESSRDDQQNVFQICHDIFEKHFTKLQPFGVLQFALALCYFRTLKSSLVNNIFSVQFLDIVDEELASSVGYGTYPLRVRNAFMELNRAVCIDMPDESNIPWFHQSFCENIVSTNNPREHYIHREVNMVLGEVLNDPAFIKRDMYSPYFYFLDFLIEFDKKGRPIKPIQKKRSIFSLSTSSNDLLVEVGRKVAILVLPHRGFSRNVRTLKGFYKLRRRHLEILGYHVVEIDPQLWNSMYMSEPMAKNDFLENRIFSRSMTNKVDII